jgi:beta-phosphoglucomutase family hydrolase
MPRSVAAGTGDGVGALRGIQAVLFDMDGVLVDSIPAHREAWNAALRENSLPELDGQTYLAFAGKTNWDILTEHLDQNTLTVSSVAKRSMIDRKEHLVRKLIRQDARPTPGVRELLVYLGGRKIRCAVASSGEMANIVAVLQVLDIANYFTSVVSGSLLSVSKPNPMIFMLAAGSLGVDPGHCLVIEDAPAGVEAARAAGMACCALATTFPAPALHGASLVLENLSQVSPQELFDDD